MAVPHPDARRLVRAESREGAFELLRAPHAGRIDASMLGAPTLMFTMFKSCIEEIYGLAPVKAQVNSHLFVAAAMHERGDAQLMLAKLSSPHSV